MNSIKNIFITLTGMAVLTACTAIDIEKTRNMPSKGNAFQQALHKEYAELAFLEDDEGDSDDAVYFNNKALMAAAGNKVGPQKIKDRNLPKDGKAELDAARRILVAELGSGAKDRMPAKAARAQAMFDCWMQEKEENDQPKDIARCRSAFNQALSDLGKRPMTRAVPAPAPAPTPSREYMVYFDTDSAKINAAAETVIKQAAADYKGRKKAKVSIVGHTDTVGDNDYNMTLSDKRADAVTMRLVDMGVSGKRLKKDRQGETSPAVATGDNKNEPKNRRVSISIGN